MYEVDYNGWMSSISTVVFERDLLAELSFLL